MAGQQDVRRGVDASIIDTRAPPLAVVIMGTRHAIHNPNGRVNLDARMRRLGTAASASSAIRGLRCGCRKASQCYEYEHRDNNYFHGATLNG